MFSVDPVDVNGSANPHAHTEITKNKSSPPPGQLQVALIGNPSTAVDICREDDAIDCTQSPSGSGSASIISTSPVNQLPVPHVDSHPNLSIGSRDNKSMRNLSLSSRGSSQSRNPRSSSATSSEGQNTYHVVQRCTQFTIQSGAFLLSESAIGIMAPQAGARAMRSYRCDQCPSQVS